MAQRKHSFRFRIPWLSESSSRRPKDTSKSTSQSDTNVPIQRPSVITPAESPPSPTKTQEAPRRIEPQNKSPPHITHPTTPSSTSVIVETTQSKSPSPSTSPNLVNSPPPSLQQPSSSHDIMKVPKAEEITHPSSSASQQEKEKIVNKSEPIMRQEIEPEPKPEPGMKVSSPLKGITKSPETSFQPTQPVGFEHQASSMPSLSPVSKTEQTSEVLKSNHEETTTSHASSTSQEEKEKMAVTVSETVPQEAEEPKTKSPLKIITKSPENLSTQHTATTLDEERSISKTPKAPLETQSKFLQHEEEKEKVVHETKEVGKAKDTSTSQPKFSLTKESASGTKDKKKHGVRETVERKIMFATSNSIGKDIGVVNSTDPRTSNVSSSSISPQRTVPSNEERENEKGPLQKGIKDDVTKFVHKIAASVHPTQPIEDKQFSVITLAGDNRGATMQVGSEAATKEGSIHIHRAYKSDPDEESTEVTTDGEGNSTNTEEEDSMEDGEVGKACVNSNIQSINNSLMYHGSITERDPGVQVTLPQKPLEPIKPNDKDTHNHRTEFNISRAQKSTYQPTVQRRCLRGLFHEPSESDPDNPDKPRRHGCKFSCDKNNEDIEIM